VNVRLTLPDLTKIQIRIINSIGQTMKTISAVGQTGKNTIAIDIKDLSTGIYCMEINDGNTSIGRKLVIE